MKRSIHFEEIENFRDLGGYECSFGETEPNVVYRSATIHRASKQDVDRMAELGIKTILDLRSPKERELFPDSMRCDPRFCFYELNVNGSGRIATDSEDLIASYFEMLEDAPSARKILQTILHAEKPVLIHCSAGKDRTGIFSALLLLFAGVQMDDVNADYMASFPYLPKMTADTKAFHPEVSPVYITPSIYVLPGFFEQFLARYGDLDQYAESIGLSGSEIGLLHNLLGKQEKSCGAVLMHKGKILVEHMGLGHYSIPKGHVEAVDRDERDTARREIKEELGLNVSFLDGFRVTTDYSPYPGIAKKVVWFLSEAESEAATVDQNEVIGCSFLSPKEALKILTHEDDRRVVRQALLFLQKKTAD